MRGHEVRRWRRWFTGSTKALRCNDRGEGGLRCIGNSKILAPSSVNGLISSQESIFSPRASRSNDTAGEGRYRRSRGRHNNLFVVLLRALDRFTAGQRRRIPQMGENAGLALTDTATATLINSMVLKSSAPALAAGAAHSAKGADHVGTDLRKRSQNPFSVRSISPQRFA